MTPNIQVQWYRMLLKCRFTEAPKGLRALLKLIGLAAFTNEDSGNIRYSDTQRDTESHDPVYVTEAHNEGGH